MPAPYTFGPFVLDPRQRVLFRDGAIVRLTPKALDLLLLLVERAGEVVPKGELIEALWPDVVVDDAGLARLVSVLRKELGEMADGQPWVETYPKRGYRFAGTLTGAAPSPPSPQPATSRRRVPVALLGGIGGVVIAAVVAWFLWRANAHEGSGRPYLAVLPFTAAEGTPAAGAFAEGIGEAVAVRLSAVPEINVIHPSVAARIGNLPPQRIARELGASLLLRGTVQRSGNALRVDYAVLSAADGREVETGSVKSASADLFENEDALADRIATSLRRQQSARREGPSGLTGPEEQRVYIEATGYLSSAIPGDTRVDEALLLLQPLMARAPRSAMVLAAAGDAYWRRFDVTRRASDLAEAERLAGKAVALDPAAARVHVLLGAISRSRGQYARAMEQFRLALAAEPDADDILASLAWACYGAGRRDEAESIFQRNLEVHPQCAVCLVNYAEFLNATTRSERAIDVCRRAAMLDPENPAIQVCVGTSSLFAGHIEEAIPYFERANSLHPDAVAYRRAGLCHYLLRDYDRAAASLEEAARLRPDTCENWAILAFAAAHVAGRMEEVKQSVARALAAAEAELQRDPGDAITRALMAETLALSGDRATAAQQGAAAVRDDPTSPEVLWHAATEAALSGREDDAIDRLTRGMRHGLPLRFVTADPAFDALRGNPRFHRLVAGSWQ